MAAIMFFLRILRYLFPFVVLYCVFVMLKNLGNTEKADKEDVFSNSYGKKQKTEGPWEPYHVLGCNRQDSDEEVRRAYRHLLVKYHPDRFIGMDLDADFVQLASERFSNIQKAYQEICKLRSMS